MFVRILALASVSFSSLVAMATPVVGVSLRSFSTTQCQYYYNTAGEFNVTLQDDSLVATDTVYLVAAFQQTRGTEIQNWTLQHEVQMTPARVGTAAWAALLVQDIAYRSGPSLTEMQFVFKVISKNGATRFEKGNSSTLGYFAAPIANELACVDNGPFFPLQVRSVEKN